VCQVWEAESGRLVCTPFKALGLGSPVSILSPLVTYIHRDGEGAVERARVVMALNHDPLGRSLCVHDVLTGEEVSTFKASAQVMCLTGFRTAAGHALVLLGLWDGAVVVVEPETGQ
jgi:hypothetical protein